jgi:hypothetical protein
MIQQYLQSTHSITQTHITKLTASTPADTDALQPPEEPSSWPTFENVTACFSRITSMSLAGDHVYIHYSGHGTRTSNGELALALLDEAEVGKVRYLSGLKLAEIINRMVEHGLKITLVLDCCFSGSLVRHEDQNNVRYIDYDPGIEPENSTSDNESQGHILGPSSSRDASMLANWLINPDCHTMLTACGPHEVAKELRFESGERQGALSYFLSRTLWKLGKLSVSHLSIYQLLCARFHASWPLQNPMFFGSRDLSFFGDLEIASRVNFVPVFKLDDGTLCLRVGRAHGTSKCDTYALYPINISEFSCDISKEKYVKARIRRALAVTSELELVDNKLDPVGTGWKAMRLNSLSLKKIPVLLTDNVGEFDQWIGAISQNRSFELFPPLTDGYPFLFKIVADECRQFEILDHSDEKIYGLPTLPFCGSKQAMSQVLDIIEHLTKIKQIESMENELLDNSFSELVELQLGTASSKSCVQTGFVEVKHEEELFLTIWNKGDKPIYLHIYDLTPSWEARNILKAEYVTVPAKDEKILGAGAERKKFMLTMRVPEVMIERGQFWCDDIVKIFITLQQTSFAGFVMGAPSLKNEEKGQDCNAKSPSIGPKTAKRGPDEHLNDWMTRNFRFRIVRETPSPAD